MHYLEGCFINREKFTRLLLEYLSGILVTLPGLGKFSCRERPARMVRNPATGEQMHKDADKVVKVTIAKALKDVINA